MAKATKSASSVKVPVAGRFGPKGGETVLQRVAKAALKVTPAGTFTSVVIKKRRMRVRKAPHARYFRPLAS